MLNMQKSITSSCLYFFCTLANTFLNSQNFHLSWKVALAIYVFLKTSVRFFSPYQQFSLNAIFSFTSVFQPLCILPCCCLNSLINFVIFHLIIVRVLELFWIVLFCFVFIYAGVSAKFLWFLFFEFFYPENTFI